MGANVGRNYVRDKLGKPDRDTSLSLSQSPERPVAHSGRDPRMPLLYPSPHFLQLGTPKGTTFRSLAKWERESGEGVQRTFHALGVQPPARSKLL